MEIPVVALVSCFKMPFQIPFLCCRSNKQVLNEHKQRVIFLPFGLDMAGLGSFRLSYVDVQDKQTL